MAPSNGSVCASMLLPPKHAYSNWLPLFLVNISFSAKPPAEGYSSSLTDNHPTGPTHISIKLCCEVRAEKSEFRPLATSDYPPERIAACEVAHLQHWAASQQFFLSTGTRLLPTALPPVFRRCRKLKKRG